MNSSGRVLWEGLAAGRDGDQLVAALPERYGNEAGQAEADVAASIADLRAGDVLAE